MVEGDAEAVDGFFKQAGGWPAKPELAAAAGAFAAQAKANGKTLAIVTAGGTTAPLEKRVVRYIDNFSSGNRGAGLAEHLLEKGYAVLFVHRKSGAFPYARDVVQALVADPASALSAVAGRAPHDPALVERAAAGASLLGDESKFLAVPFETVGEYLGLLRCCCGASKQFGAKAVVILAAAVSDFYVAELAEHKIQSRSTGGGLSLALAATPKCLGLLRTWGSDQACLVGFKLETDKALLETKATTSLKTYGLDAVVANMLADYRLRAVVYGRRGGRPVEGLDGDLDAKLADAIAAVHAEKIAASESMLGSVGSWFGGIL